MKLEGIHHITAITGDAPANVEFYVGVLGLRMVKRTVNQDDPSVYHLFYGDEDGLPGSDMTFFEYPGAAPGRPGAGTVHLINWRVASPEAIDFWESRLSAHEVDTEMVDGRLRFSDPEGLRHELVVSTAADEPLVGGAPDVPRELALQGFEGARAFASDPDRSREFLEGALAFEGLDGSEWEVRGEQRGGRFSFDPAPDERARQGAGSVHHIAFNSGAFDQEEWRRRITGSGAGPTPVIDRFYFKSVYFREPSGVLFELATPGPGFAQDEDADHLGERLSLPPDFEAMRERIEPNLRPLPDPRARLAEGS